MKSFHKPQISSLRRYSYPGIENATPAYQAAFQEDVFSLRQEFVRHMLAHDIARSRRMERCLDIGCNSGHTTAVVAEYFRETVGVDTSRPLIELGKTKFPSLSFQIGDARNLPFPDRSFDCVTGLHSFNCLSKDEFKHALVESMRVAKPGGLIILDFSPCLSRAEAVLRACWYFLRGHKTFLSSIRYFGIHALRKKEREAAGLSFAGIDIRYVIRLVNENGGHVLQVHQPWKSYFRRLFICGVVIERRKVGANGKKTFYCTDCLPTYVKK